MAPSFLEIVDKIDSFPYYANDPVAYKEFMKDYFYFTIDGYSKPLGYVHHSIIERVDWPDYWTIDSEARTLHLCVPNGPNAFEERSKLVDATIWIAQKQRKIPELGWRGDAAPVYTPEGEHVFNMNDVGSQLFGIISFGVHLIAWETTAQGRQYWLQRRSMKKRMHPGKLDTMAGGGLKLGEKPLDAMARETFEEANIPTEFSLSHLKPCGVISYHLDYSFLNNPLSIPHVLHVFEMELPADLIPNPNDGEVSSFLSMSEAEVIDALFKDDFKPIVGIQWVAHFCRNGILNPENEPKFLEISSRVHRNLATFVV
ncbi:NUDIX hydrolase domain-like protein [Nemania diffusa]|nr:NUDIX hydrolase domain-like protein [Nemania diffusa]